MSRMHLAVAVVLLSTVAPFAQIRSPWGEPQAEAEYPPQDLATWFLVHQGFSRSAAARPREADSVEAVAFDARTDRSRMVDTLGRIVDRHPERIASALAAVRDATFELRGDSEAARQHWERMRDIAGRARRQLARLPREPAGHTARQLIWVEAELARGERPNAWVDALARFVDEYRGTEAALLAEVDLITSGRVSREMFDQLETFVAQHPGTTAAAKALYQQGFQWHTINTLGTVEPRGADPAPRLLRVVAIVKELESGRYPRSEWTDRAPSLISGFFTPSDTMPPPTSVDVMLAAYEEFARTHFRIDHLSPAGNGVGYVITSKIADLLAMKGDRVGGVERLLDRLEKSGPDPAAVRYLRGVFLMEEADRSPDDGERLTQRAREVLGGLADDGAGLYHRRALATLATMHFAQEDWAAARAAFQRYLTSHPQRSWSWVAALRIGQCEERLGNSRAAADAYLAAADRYRALPLARVLGHEYAARAFEAAGEFARALENRRRALDGWDNAYGLRYSTYVRASRRVNDPFVAVTDVAEVVKDTLAPQIARMQTALREPGGERLQRSQVLLAGGRHLEAVAELQRLLAEHPRSALVPEARVLIHRARLEQALHLADSDAGRPDEEAALRELTALAREPTDFAVTAAAIARASLLWKRGEVAPAETAMREALAGWQAQQRPSSPGGGLDADVAAIRTAVFLPAGGGVYQSLRWNAFDWPSSPAPFMLANADVRVRLHDGDVRRVTLVQRVPGHDNLLFFDTDQMAVLTRIMTTLGGTRRREPRQIMETPNQPIGDSMRILALWTRFFPARPGHWGGWELLTYPVITGIDFKNPERTKAVAHVTIGYSGGSVELDKEGASWVTKRLTSIWIT